MQAITITLSTMWNKFQEFLKSIGLDAVLLLAGIAGAFVSISQEKKLTFAERIITIVSGGLTANYMTPIFINFLNTSDSISYGLAFVLGYMGLKSVEFIIDYFHKKFKDK